MKTVEERAREIVKQNFSYICQGHAEDIEKAISAALKEQELNESSLKENKMESKTLTVYKEDIKKIGHTVHEEFCNNIGTDNTCIVCSGRTAGIEEILLREILSIYGYEIIASNDVICNDDYGSADVVFVTDIPWNEYMAIST